MKRESFKIFYLIVFSFILIIAFLYLISGQTPILHNIQGYIFHNDGAQVQVGTKVRINASVTGSFVTTQTSGPPGNTGFYASSINASDGENITITAFNATAFGRNTTALLNSPSITRANITMNNTRLGETDINITTVNNSIYDKFKVFNVTFNVTAIGGANSVNCNATIIINNENIINLTSNNKTKNIGNITLGNTNNSFFEVRALNEGTTTLNITSSCSSDGENFDNLFRESITLRAANQPPQLHAVQGFIFNIDNTTQVPSGTNVTINASVTGSFITTQTSGPPGNTGFYAGTINARDGELIIIYSQNGTYEGTRNITLVNAPGTTRVNVSLDTKITADISINSSDIKFSYGNLIENLNITLNATVRNIGRANVGSFIVQFFKGDPELGGIQVNGNKTVNNLTSGSSVVVNVNYAPSVGSNNIFVVIDTPLATNGSIQEGNETNNKANNTLFLTGWQEFYGNISIDKLLGDNGARNLSIWYGEQSFSGNVFIVDSESNIRWNSLLPIGKNITGGNTTDDFSDIDSILGMFGFSDSVSNVFTSDGNTPRQSLDFLVHKKNITNAAVVNSTDNTNFFTGILWDSSDDVGDWQYSQDDREDLVFVTKVNKGAQGKYGLYDYEARIPVKLREYYTGDQNNVFIYFDIN